MNTHTHTALRALAEACGAETGMHAEKLVWIKFHKPALEKLAACVVAPAAALFDAGREAAAQPVALLHEAYDALLDIQKLSGVVVSPSLLRKLYEAITAQPAAQEPAGTLPTLPQAAYSLDLSDGHPVVAYSAQQMYNFARAALAEQTAYAEAEAYCRGRDDEARKHAAQPAAQDWAAVETIPLSCPRCGEVLHVAQPAAQEPSMRHILLIQIHNLIDLAERYAARMQAIDPDEQRYAEGAAAYARKVIEPYNYNGPDRAQPAAQEPSKPVLWVARAKCDSENTVVGELSVEDISEKQFEMHDPDVWECIPLYTHPAQPAAQEPTLTPAQKLDALKFGANVATNLLQIGRSIGFGRAQQILGEQWEAEHDCAPRGRMGVTVKDEAQPAAQEPAAKTSPPTKPPPSTPGPSSPDALEA